MKLNAPINDNLNIVLKDALTLINQTFLHARMLDNWGFKVLGGRSYHLSIELMRQADKVIKRILFLEGLPNLQALGALSIGENAEEIIKADHQAIHEYRDHIVSALSICETEQDYQSREHLEAILHEVEEAIDFYETQTSLIAELGVQNYLQSQVEPEGE